MRRRNPDPGILRIIIHEAPGIKRKTKMIKFDIYDLVYIAVYTFLFGTLLLISGLDYRQSLSIGIILAQFYLALVKIHHKIRR